jgi:type I restriction enzyme M protein
MDLNGIAGFIWSVADLLRGDYKQSDYGKVILPFTLLRRLDCVLEPTKAAVLAEYTARKNSNLPLDTFLLKKASQTFYNTSELDLGRLLADPNNIRANLSAYVSAFSENARDIFERYDFQAQIDRLENAGLLYLIVQKFDSFDLHPRMVVDAVDRLVAGAHKVALCISRHPRLQRSQIGCLSRDQQGKQLNTPDPVTHIFPF